MSLHQLGWDGTAEKAQVEPGSQFEPTQATNGWSHRLSWKGPGIPVVQPPHFPIKTLRPNPCVLVLLPPSLLVILRAQYLHYSCSFITRLLSFLV